MKVCVSWAPTMLAVIAAGTLVAAAQAPGVAPGGGVYYTNILQPEVPWSIHLLKIDRRNPQLTLQSVHARGEAIGMSPLSEQIELARKRFGAPVAGVNGDFYQRAKTYEGNPRGLQISGGELLRGPSGGVAFWINAAGEPHAQNIASHFSITWPDGSSGAFHLNEGRSATNLVLYTPAIGKSTRTKGGRELILEPVEGSRWLPLKVGLVYSARVREIQDNGNSVVAPDTLVLSVDPAMLGRIPALQPGTVLRFSTETLPALHGIRTAIGGGPVLVSHGTPFKVHPTEAESYEFSSMLERHPRVAVGWNDSAFFLVEVDGRQKGFSVGMTLDELAKFLVKNGCREAMNMDGGGSATLWYDGKVRNNPCDGYERPIANALVVVKKEINPATSGSHQPVNR